MQVGCGGVVYGRFKSLAPVSVNPSEVFEKAYVACQIECCTTDSNINWYTRHMRGTDNGMIKMHE